MLLHLIAASNNESHSNALACKLMFVPPQRFGLFWSVIQRFKLWFACRFTRNAAAFMSGSLICSGF
jgi:hypothetical protein